MIAAVYRGDVAASEHRRLLDCALKRDWKVAQATLTKHVNDCVGDMIAKGLCSVLASDYYYPAPLLAAFRLAADGVRPLAAAWQLISSAPARAAGLTDRGTLAVGQRADIILVDDTAPLRPRIVAVVAAGRLAHLTEANRLVRSSVASRKAVAAA